MFVPKPAVLTFVCFVYNENTWALLGPPKAVFTI